MSCDELIVSAVALNLLAVLGGLSVLSLILLEEVIAFSIRFTRPVNSNFSSGSRVGLWQTIKSNLNEFFCDWSF
jgi:hypothetical protein